VLSRLKNMFKVADLRGKVLFTVFIIMIFRLGCHIPCPYVDFSAIQQVQNQAKLGGAVAFLDLFSGGALTSVAVFALGIMPYITASIIMQLLAVVIPKLEEWQNEGQVGQKKITQWTRYMTVALALMQSTGIIFSLHQGGGFLGTNQLQGIDLIPHFNAPRVLLMITTLTAGTAMIMWLGEVITQRGIGNGMSLIIYAGIVVGFPRAVLQTFDQMRTGQIGLIRILFLLVLMAFVVAAIVFIERGHRRITVQYAKRIVGRRMYGGSSTHIPLKVNTGGVIPVIFASSILAFPATIASAFKGGWVDTLTTQLGIGMPLYNLLYVAGIIFFTYFYTAIIFNPDDVAENMRKYGGFVPGIRPGKRTAEYIDTILTRITLAGAVYLALIALLPQWLISGFKVAPIPFVGEWLDANIPRFITEGMNVPYYFGGTSLLIVVGVAMDTVQQVESQLIMRHYDGFMKKTRIRGRRA